MQMRCQLFPVLIFIISSQPEVYSQFPVQLSNPDFKICVTDGCLPTVIDVAADLFPDDTIDVHELDWHILVDFNDDWKYEHAYGSKEFNWEAWYGYDIPFSEMDKWQLNEGMQINDIDTEGARFIYGWQHRIVWRIFYKKKYYSSTQYFRIHDCDDPTINCTDTLVYRRLDTDEELEISINHIAIDAFDNCTENEELEFTIAHDNLSYLGVHPMYYPLDFSIDDLKFEHFYCDTFYSKINAYAVDKFDNYSSCSITVGLIDPFLCITSDGGIPVEGKIVDSNETPREGFVINFSAYSVSWDSLYPTIDRKFKKTDSQGEFEIQLIYQDAYNISLYKNSPINSGIDEADIGLLERYLNGDSMILSGNELIAADMNLDGLIDYEDFKIMYDIVDGSNELPSDFSQYVFYIRDDEDKNIYHESRKKRIGLCDIHKPINLVVIKLGDLNHSSFD